MEKPLVIVTGGCGYIGLQTVVQLLENGSDVISIDNFCHSRPQSVELIHQLVGNKSFVNHNIDLCSKDDVFRFFDRIGRPFSVIHFAALKSVPESIERPDLYYNNNLVSLINVLEACIFFKANSFVFSSSCSVYGEISRLPVSEDTPLGEPCSPYARTKVIGELLVKDYSKAFGLCSICLRYFNPVGAHPSGMLGEIPIGQPTNLIPVLTQTAIGLRESFEVFGGSLPTRDGSCIRDYVHVVDIAEAHIKALDLLLKTSSKFEIINLGSGLGITVFEAIKMLERVSKRKINYTICGPRAGDVIEIYSDCKKAKDMLGWKPKNDLQSMIESAWKWEVELSGMKCRYSL